MFPKENKQFAFEDADFHLYEISSRRKWLIEPDQKVRHLGDAVNLFPQTNDTQTFPFSVVAERQLEAVKYAWIFKNVLGV